MRPFTRWINDNPVWALIAFIFITLAWMVGVMAFIMNQPLVASFLLFLYVVVVPLVAGQIKKNGATYGDIIDDLVKDVITITGYMLILFAFAYFFPTTWKIWHFSVSFWISIILTAIVIVAYSHLKYKWLRIALIVMVAAMLIAGIIVEYGIADKQKEEASETESYEKKEKELELREKEAKVAKDEQDLKDRHEAPLNKRLKEVLDYYDRKAECFGTKTYTISKDTVRVFLPQYSEMNVTITKPYGASIEFMDANGLRFSYSGHKATPLNGGEALDLQTGDYIRFYTSSSSKPITADIDVVKKSDEDIKTALAAGK